MEVLRVRVSGFVIVIASALLSACSGSSGSNGAGDAISVTGSVGDGPVVGAEILITDANGTVLDRGDSDATANYAVNLPAGVRPPVLFEASGGVDLVTGRPLDFTLVGAALETGSLTVNLSPHTTIAVRAAQCTAQGLTPESLEEARKRVHQRFSMGLDEALVPDPMADPVDRDNVEAVVLASEALGETVRRTVTALANAGFALEADTIVEHLACDLMDRATTRTGEPVSQRAIVAFAANALPVRLETLAGRLEVDGQSAVAAMNEAIRIVIPEFAAPDVAGVSVTPAAREQALENLAHFQSGVDRPELIEVAGIIRTADRSTLAQRLDAALTPALQNDLRGLADNLAFASEAEIEEIVARDRLRAEASAPIVSLAATPASVDAGQRTELSWASVHAERCVASGAWSGAVGLEGAATSEALQRSASFELTCVGLGGVTQRTIRVRVRGGDRLEPEPEPEPSSAPTVSLEASAGEVASGGSTEIVWTASDATSCTAGGSWLGVRATQGSLMVGPLLRTATYRLTCTGPGGTTSDSVTVTVDEPEQAAPEPAPEPVPAPAPEPAPEPAPAPEPVPEPAVDLQASDLVVNEGGSVVLSWSSAHADSCSASGGWSGSRPTSGTESVGPLSQQTSFTLTCSGSGGNAVSMMSVAVNGTVALSWQAPTENTDGTPLTDLSEYRVYVGESSRDYGQSFDVPSGASSYELTLASGEYYLAMTAIDADGNESAYSNEIVRTVD